jgi:serine/threonine protein kinase/Tfp pilus assembly protein PilF
VYSSDLADLSVEPSTIRRLSPEQKDRLTDILDRYLSALENGVPPDREALLEEHPELAGPLATYLDSLEELHDVAAGFGEASPRSETEAETSDDEEKRLGDFKLLREIGRGGMGVVYEATQVSLGRRVALKVLPFAAVLDQKQIERFKNEARAAAQLLHPNIVPVFSVGCERGVHYYAMQYVEGQSLDVAIQELRHMVAPKGSSASSPDDGGVSTVAAARNSISDTCKSAALFHSFQTPEYPKSVAELGVQVAEALHCAHEYGVIHRDVKPSNLLLDGQGKVWVTDFGLARFQTDARVTMTGDVVGTLRYMSPEQAAGRAAAIDERTDVYSLGIALYELLTLRDAFEGSDRQELLRRIDTEEPLPPRRINPAIPIDLETIILKAISKSRETRYATAKEFADDLRRFLEGKPTLARRPTLPERLAKWGRRHKAIVRSTAVLAMVALIGFAVSTFLVTRALKQSEENRRQAVQFFDRATDAVDRFGIRYPRKLARIPGAEAIRNQMLHDALAHYNLFIEEAGENPDFRRAFGLAHTDVGTIREQLGDHEGALAAYRKAEEILEDLTQEQPGADRNWGDLATCYNNIGLLLNHTGKTAEAQDAYRKAIEIQERLVDECPDSERYPDELALSYSNFGLLADQTNQISLAHEAYLAAIRIGEGLVEKHPGRVGHLHNLAVSYSNLSRLCAKTDMTEAARHCRRAVAIQEKLVRSNPQAAKYQNDLALSYNNLGALLSHDRQFEQARASYLRAIGIQEDLVRKSPSRVEFSLDLALSHNNLGKLYLETNDRSTARKSFESARSLLEELVANCPDDVNFRSSLGGALNNLGMALEKSGRLEEALQVYQEGIEHQRCALDDAQDIGRFREFLSKQYGNYGQALRAAGRVDEAVEVALARKRLWPEDPERLFAVAAELALAARQMETAKSDRNPNRELARRQFADAAVATLQEAVDAGFDSFDLLRSNADFDAIRRLPKFRQLAARRTGSNGP